MNRVRSAEFDLVVQVKGQSRKPNFKVDLWTPYDYYNSYGAIVETYAPMTFNTGTACKIGTSGCPRV